MQSFKIARVMGIPIELHITFILLLILVYYFWDIGGFILYVFLFTSVVLHELGHSYVAKKYGVHIEKILLLPIGGMAMMDRIPKEGEFKIAIAGPIVSIILGILFLGLSTFMDFNILKIDNMVYPLFMTVGVLNLMLGVFNLLPAFPMDGGRVLRALISHKVGYLKATKIASTIGQYLSLIMLGFGIISLNIILILIAIFIYYGASQEYHALLSHDVFNKIKVKDIMSEDIVSVSPDDSIKDLVDLMFKYKYMGYPVVKDGKLVGSVSFNDIRNVDENISVKDIMKPPIVVSKNMDLNDLLLKMGNSERAYVVENNKLKGIISKTDIIRILKLLGLKRYEDNENNKK
ncbi:site-2 protease family protein [Methanothermococcus okinawensis]|uniref:Zinc metalloprotease n=1 Tax=Methanothermococcus okinawensis (strain DSM 14208 / JCM 11175 / IH1) TaxID=647113 RepID=F8ANF0_METOI|nr:site-2 protease family protein [Methanothermococcus okinawensis]AEH06214.1 CBS domain containing protein [Methanothermococcus okinawensis IH1]